MYCSPNNSDEFQCKFNECIKWSYVCDGVSHCSNRADEDCDMCTNDFYICKDSSRINCTLACSTLGYIPCKNYVDKKICASVNKKLASSSSSFFRHHLSTDGGGDRFKFSNLLGRSFRSDEDDGNTWIATLIGSSLLIISAVLLVGLLFMFHKRKRKKMSRACNIMAADGGSGRNHIDPFHSDIYNQTSNNLRFNSLSHNPTAHRFSGYYGNGGDHDLDAYSTSTSNLGKDDLKFMSLRDHPNVAMRKEELLVGDGHDESPLPLSKLAESNNYFIDNGILIRKEAKAESDWLFSYLDQFKSVNDSVQVNINENEPRQVGEDEDEEEEYAEPPPSYKQAKYYPKATLISVRKSTTTSNSENRESSDVNTASSSIDEEVVYENIEEESGSNGSSSRPSNPSQFSSSEQSTSCRKFFNSQNVASSSSRRGRFQGLKNKHRVTAARPVESTLGPSGGIKSSAAVSSQCAVANTVLSCTTSNTMPSSSVLSNHQRPLPPRANHEEFI